MIVALGLALASPAPGGRAPEEVPRRQRGVERGYVTAADGVRLYYEKIGWGPEVVLVPGRLFLARDFARLASSERTLVFYDMRDRGRSDGVADTTALSIQHEVADLESVREHFGAPRVSVIGYSYLGLLVALYAIAHPERVERIVQLGPVPRRYGTRYPAALTARDSVPVFDSAAVRRVRELRAAGYDRTHPREFCEIAWSVDRVGLVGDPANADRLGPGPCDMPNEYPINLARHFRYAFASVQRLDVPAEDVRRIAAPVLTIHGTKDRNADYGSGREWAATLRDARLLTVRGAAHQSWAEYPELVIGAIGTFLRGEWPAGAERISRVEP
jgi:proline iminopeptidase